MKTENCKSNDDMLFDPTDLYDQYLSYFDLLHFDGFKEAWKDQDLTVVEKALDAMGVDLRYGYEMTVQDHRCRIGQKQRLSCPRFGFKEKSDPNCVRNYMSVEDIIRTTSDKSLRDEMNQMSKRQGLGLHIKNNVKDEDE